MFIKIKIFSVHKYNKKISILLHLRLKLAVFNE